MRGQALRQAALERAATRRPVMMRGSRSNGKIRSVPCVVAVDREGDALGQERLVGLELALPQLGCGDARAAPRRAARQCGRGRPAASNISS